MKLKIWMVAGLTAMSLSAQAALFSYDWTVGVAIPDGDQNGYVNNQTISDAIQLNPAFPADPFIASVVGVRLNISGGWNGDLYVYLRHETAGGVGFTTLLNRVGRTTSPNNPIGYTTAGMNITLIEGAGAGNIHSVESPTSGESYQVDATGSSVTFNSFQNLDPNGTWSLLVADLSGNHVSTLNGWELDIQVVPEPTTWALGIFGALGGLAGIGKMVHRRFNPTPVASRSC